MSSASSSTSNTPAISYATAAGSTAAKEIEPAAAAVPVAAPNAALPSASGSEKNPSKEGKEGAKEPKEAKETKDKEAKEGDKTQPPKPAPVSLTPAPVPAVNPWTSKGSAAVTTVPSQASPASRRGSADKSGKPLDPSNWPKPDEKKSESGSSNTPAAVKARSGKEKWVPYSGPIGAPPSSAGKSGASTRKPHRSQNGKPAIANGSAPARGKTSSATATAKPVAPSAAAAAPAAPVASTSATSTSTSTSTGPVKSGPTSATTATAAAASGPAVASTTTSTTTKPVKKSPVSGNATPTFGGNKRFSSNNRFHHDSSLHNNNGFHHNRYQNNFANGGRRPSHFKGGFWPAQEFMYGPHMMQAAAAAAVQTAPGQYEAALGLVIAQLEYYVSVENLCKDIYLRRQMNSKGLVPLSIISNFGRMKALTNGDVNLIAEACRWAPNVELIGDRLRPRHNWQAWVLPFEDRMPIGKEETSDEEVLQFQQQQQQQTVEADEEDKKDSKLVFNAASAVPFVPKKTETA
ncbi:hypothetical protein TRVA0_002S04412 [Trichomonascus vanleenenianus]|uniref:uncharacterized protein n=1 Tax=Trichomonascus vanleenenianus TaxID=2268995 RepID=UPI003ECB159D